MKKWTGTIKSQPSIVYCTLDICLCPVYWLFQPQQADPRHVGSPDGVDGCLEHEEDQHPVVGVASPNRNRASAISHHTSKPSFVELSMSFYYYFNQNRMVQND